MTWEWLKPYIWRHFTGSSTTCTPESPSNVTPLRGQAITSARAASSAIGVGPKAMFIGVEIGGTKLQLGIGAGNGVLRGLWRETVEVGAGPEGIRRQITRAVPELLDRARLERTNVLGVGVGFG